MKKPVFLTLALVLTTLMPGKIWANQLTCLFTKECALEDGCSTTDLGASLRIINRDQVEFQTELGISQGVILPGGADDTLHVVTFPTNRSAELISVFSDGTAHYTLQGFAENAFTLTLIGQCTEL